MKPRLLALSLMGLLAGGCKGKDDKEASGPILVLASMPESFKLADGTYPVATCIPLQLRTADSDNQPVATSDLSVAISVAASSSLEEKVLTPPAGAEKAPVFGDSACKDEVAGTTLKTMSGTINLATVYLTASKPGTVWIQVDYATGTMHMRFRFSTPSH